MPATQELIGRDAELAELAAFVRVIPSGFAAMIVEGEPGIGKTSVLTSALADVPEQAMVLRCQAARPETELSLACLADLLNPVIENVLPALPVPLAMALEIALLRIEPGPAPLEQRTLMTAVTHVIRLLAERGPLVLAIDDMQWLDPSTATVLGFALRRLDGEPAGVLASVRTPGEPGSAGLLADLPRDRVMRLTLGPLSASALAQVLRSRVSADLPWPLVQRIHEASRGNPLHAMELARSLGPDGPAMSGPLQVPPSLRQLASRRLAALPSDAADTLLLAAATSELTLTRLARALGVSEDDAEKAIQLAVLAGIVTSYGGTIEFTHPLWPAAAYAAAGPDRRRRAHERLAAVTANQEEHARHRALSAPGPDELVAADLADAARSAAARGAVGAAAELADLAAGLTPDAAARLERRIDAARYLCEAGDAAGARRSLEGLTRDLPAGPARARALLALGQVRMFDLATAPVMEMLSEALTDAAGDEALQGEVHLAMSWMCEADLRAGLEHARAAEQLLAGHGEPALRAASITAELMFEALTGGGLRQDLADRGLALEQRVLAAPAGERPSFQVASILVTCDRLDEARAQLWATLDLIAAEQPAAARFEVLSALVHTELQAGNWDAAQQLAAEADASVRLTGQEDQRAWTAALQAEVDAVRGRVGEARAKAGDALRQSAEAGSEFGMLRVLPVLGFVALSEGKLAEAIDYLARADDLCERIGLTEPGRFRFHADYAEALIATGDLDRAAEVIGRLEQRGRHLGRRWALATSARCGALLAMARGYADDALRAIETALSWHDGLPVPFELGRTHLAAGEIHRRCKHRKLAAEQLRWAAEIFDRLGAPLWSARASAELARVGLRTSSPFELSETERQVASLVASGLTNREVAARMFVSLRTVESSLSQVYRKLGIRSRTELARRFPAD